MFGFFIGIAYTVSYYLYGDFSFFYGRPIFHLIKIIESLQRGSIDYTEDVVDLSQYNKDSTINTNFIDNRNMVIYGIFSCLLTIGYILFKVSITAVFTNKYRTVFMKIQQQEKNKFKIKEKEKTN